MSNYIYTVGSEQSILSKNQDYKFSSCHGKSVYIYTSGSRCTWWQKTNNIHTSLFFLRGHKKQ